MSFGNPSAAANLDLSALPPPDVAHDPFRSHWPRHTTTMASQQHPPEVVSSTEGPELGQTGRPTVTARKLNTPYPVRPTFQDPLP